MRVLYAQKRLHPNSWGIAEGLQRRGHDVVMLVHVPRSGRPGLDPVVVPYYRFFSRRLAGATQHRWAIPRLGTLTRVFRTYRPDVVVLKKGRLASQIVRVAGVLFRSQRVLLSDHVLHADELPLLKRLAQRILKPGCAVHTGVHDRGRDGQALDDVPTGVGRRTSRLIPYPVPQTPGASESPEFEAGDATRPVRLIFVGSFTSSRKRPEWLVEAIARAGLTDRVTMTFVGSGGASSPGVARIREAERRHGLPASTILADLPWAEVQSLYAQHDLFVLPARDEPYGAVVGEAMMAGLPVVCSDTCGSQSAIEDGVHGLVFDSDSVDDLARCVRSLVGDRELLQRMAHNAHQRATELLSPEGWATEFERLIHDCSRADASATD